MIGIEIALLAANPQSDAQSKLALAAQVCELWVNRDENETHSAQSFLETMGLSDSRLTISAPPHRPQPFASEHGEAEYLQMGEEDRFVISLFRAGKKCSFQASGSDDFQVLCRTLSSMTVCNRIGRKAAGSWGTAYMVLYVFSQMKLREPSCGFSFVSTEFVVTTPMCGAKSQERAPITHPLLSAASLPARQPAPEPRSRCRANDQVAGSPQRPA